MAEENIKIIAQNKKARHDYFILETIEAGIELFGTEVKSVRLGKVNISDAYASISNSEVFIKGMNISPYEHGNIFNRDPLRDKKLLMHKNQIRKLIGQLQQQGFSLIPLSVYLKGSLVKVLVGVCKGKKLYDKRDDIAKRDSDRRIDRVMKERRNTYWLQKLIFWGVSFNKDTPFHVIHSLHIILFLHFLRISYLAYFVARDFFHVLFRL